MAPKKANSDKKGKSVEKKGAIADKSKDGGATKARPPDYIG